MWTSRKDTRFIICMVKGKGLPQQAEVAQVVPVRLRSRNFSTFGTTRVVGRQPYAPAAFTPRINPWYSVLEADTTPGHMVLLVTMEKIPSDTTGNRSLDRHNLYGHKSIPTQKQCSIQSTIIFPRIRG
jgi:hypothetical protein